MTKEEQILELVKRTIKGTEWENRINLVGGAVRDQIMGKPVDDLDFVVEGNISAGLDFANWLCKKWNVFKEGSNPVVFPNYGTANMHYNDVKLEFVAPRTEKYVQGSRNPIVAGGNLKDEVFRRDLTINSLLRNISTDQVLDLTGKGLVDIKFGIIRTPLDPDITFNDDPLRMLRAIRFVVKYDFKIGGEVIEGITRNADRISIISQERITEEFCKILKSNKPVEGIELLRTTGLLFKIIPEMEKMVGMTQNVHHKEDVYQHTLSVLRNTPPDLMTRLMGLFHDIGKTETRTESPTGDVNFYGHDEASAKLATKIMTRMKFPNDIIAAVTLGVKSHMSLKHGKDDASGVSDKTLRKFQALSGEYLPNFLDLVHADNMSHSDTSSMPNQVKLIKQRIDQLQTPKEKDIKLPVSGNDIISHLGIRQGPLVGKILDAIKEEWFDNPNLTREEALKIAEKIKLENQINEMRLMMKKILIN